MFVALAFRSADVADPRTAFEHQSQDFDILPGPPDSKLGGRCADVGAIEAGANALAHVHWLGSAGIGTRRAHESTKHGVARSDRQWLVHIARDIGMSRNHFTNGHGDTLLQLASAGRAVSGSARREIEPFAD